MRWAQSRWWFVAPALVCFALCGLMLRGGGSLYWGPLESDLTNVFYPWQVFVHRWIMRGVVPFWDPHVFSGYPTIETQQMVALNPVHLLSLLLSPELGLIGMTATNTVIGCAGMCWGLWRWGRLSVMAAALGGVLYVCGALFAVRVMAGHFTVVAALAWWPLAVLSVLCMGRMTAGAGGDRSEAGSGWLRYLTVQVRALWRHMGSFPALRKLLVISVFCHAMVILAGAPQYVAYLFYIDLTVVLVTLMRRHWLLPLMITAVVWALALAVSAPQWVSALWYLPYTGRGMNSSGLAGFSVEPLLNLWLEFIMPFPFGNDLTRTHLHFKNVWETATYPGGLTIVLALSAGVRLLFYSLGRVFGGRRQFCRISTPLVYASTALVCLSAYMIVGGWLPGFSGFREPAKARAVLAFALALLAPAALDGMMRRPLAWRIPLVVSATAWLIMMAFMAGFGEVSQFQRLITSFGRPIEPHTLNEYQDTLKNPAAAIARFHWAMVLGSVGAIVALLAFAGRRRWPRLVIVLLFIAAIADPFLIHSGAWLGRHPFRQQTLPPKVAQYFQSRLTHTASADALPWRVVLNWAIINRSHHMDGLFEYYGYDPLMPAYAVGRFLIAGVRNIQDVNDPTWKVPILNRVGIRYDASRWLPPGSGNPALADHYEYSTGPEVLQVPGATLLDVSRNVVAGPPGELVFGPDLQGTHFILPRGDPGGLLQMPDVPPEFAGKVAESFPVRDFATTSSSTLLDSETVVAMPHLRPDEWGFHTKLATPGLAVFKTTWLPGWRVQIDGQDTGPALFANNWMCAAIVPAGEHEVVFRYRPVGWWESWVIAGIGMAGCLALLSGWLSKRRPG